MFAAAIGGDAAVFWCCGVTGCGDGGLWVVSSCPLLKNIRKCGRNGWFGDFVITLHLTKIDIFYIVAFDKD